MFLQHIEVVVVDGREPEFETALCEVRQRVFMSPGFRGFRVVQDVEHPSTYLVEVRWETLDELAEFADSGRFERCWRPVEPFLARPLRLGHYAERPGLAFQGPGVVTDMTWLTESGVPPAHG
jgi:heme-degrading monooxygenase HmoA